MAEVDFGTYFPSGQLIDKDGGCELQPENYEYIGKMPSFIISLIGTIIFS
jgi:hypothetical protein